MKAAEAREMSVEEVHAKLEELIEESFNLRFQHTVGQLSSPIRKRQVRRDIGRLRTVLKEHETGLRTLPSKAE